jgi:hypothetical protein
MSGRAQSRASGCRGRTIAFIVPRPRVARSRWRHCDAAQSGSSAGQPGRRSRAFCIGTRVILRGGLWASLPATNASVTELGRLRLRAALPTARRRRRLRPRRRGRSNAVAYVRPPGAMTGASALSTSLRVVWDRLSMAIVNRRDHPPHRAGPARPLVAEGDHVA